MSSALTIAVGFCVLTGGSLFARLAVARPAEAPAVWAIGEGFRVDPLTGLVREEFRVDGNPLGEDFNYHQRNLAWDAARRQILLRAARNEVVAYQLQIRAPARKLTVRCGDLTGPGLIRTDEDISVFKQWYLNVTRNSTNKDSTTAAYNLGRGWYADALVPIDSGGGYGQPFDVPDRRNLILGQQWQGLWIDIYVPRDAPAGVYKGTVTISGQRFNEVLQVSLQVFDATLSDDFACEVGLNNYGSIGRKGSELRLRYYQMAHRHRLAVHEHYIQPDVKGAGTDLRGVWDDYDKQMGKYLTGAAFTARYGYRGPGQGRPLRWLYLPFETLGSHAWPMPSQAVRTPEYDQAVRTMLRDFVQHFRRRGWTKTKLMFFVNGLDEPKTAQAIDDIAYFGRLAQSAGVEGVYYRADINHMHDMHRFLPDWTDQTMLDRLGPVVDLWVCVADFLRTDFAVLLPRRKPPHSEVVWFYQNREPSVGGYCLDDETIGLRTWPVIVWKYGLDGCVLWECTFTGESKDVWIDPANSVTASGIHNLPALMMYPAKPGVAEPVASIRLKTFRRGAQDYEYLKILEAAAGRQAAERILTPVLRNALHRPGRSYGAAGDWSHNPEDWQRMRLDVLKAVVEAKGNRK